MLYIYISICYIYTYVGKVLGTTISSVKAPLVAALPIKTICEFASLVGLCSSRFDVYC